MRLSRVRPASRAAAGSRPGAPRRCRSSGVIAVFPAHQRRQAHQDRFAAAAALQAEQRAAVADQVEFDVASAPVQLELAFAFAIGRVLAALDDRQVGIEEAVADRAQVSEIALEIAVQVVEEQPADAARLVAVLEEEVLVAPALVRGVARLPAERLAQRRARCDASAARPRRTDRTASGRNRRRTTRPPFRRRAARGNGARWRASSAGRDCADGTPATRRPRATTRRPVPDARRVADGGSCVPDTSEKPTPACSNTAPSRRMRVRPPPPSSRVHASSTKRARPSACSSATQMRSCRPMR